jgi:hypothetical protein
MFRKTIIFFILLFSLFSINILLAEESFIENKGRIFINYEDYGEFRGIDSNNFNYKIKDMKGLKEAVGDFIYPNFPSNGKYKEQYNNFLKDGKIKDYIWEHVNSGNPEADILAWVFTKIVEGNEPEFSDGIKQYFIAEIFRSIGEYEMAIKAYYSVIINFPKTACWNSDSTFVWYVAPAALDKINLIIRDNPDLKIKLEGASVQVINGNDTNFKNDIVKINPGRFIRVSNIKKQDIKELSVLKTKGNGKVKLVKYSNKHWQMTVDNKPFIVKGITYTPTKVGGKSSDQNKWMFLDSNNNGILDVNEVWVDKNNNNIKDLNESIVSDFSLLKEMGVNAIRIFHMKSNSDYVYNEFNKELMRDIYNKYGIRFIMGDFLGAYGIGSGGKFTDYRNKEQRDMMKENIRKMVLDHKDEPYILMWLIGNENDMPDTSEGVNYTNTNARQYPDAYASFLKEVVDMIHSLDKNHPVIVGNMTLDLMNSYKKNSVDLDIYGINLYMGKDGFGVTWDNISKNIDVPVLITEYGCDAYFENRGEDEKGQAEYHLGNWKDIYYNSFTQGGTGNSIGGIVFEWLDEWWKAGIDPNIHVTSFQSILPFPDGYAHEEWFGVASQGNGKNSPFQRNLRKTYFVYKNEWEKNVLNI